jgi:enoyl-CoA hydratase
MSETVLLTRPEPGVALLILNRPERLNAMTAELVGALHDRLDEVADDPATRVVVLTGAGRAFCAGLDLTGYGTPAATVDPAAGPVGVALATQEEIAGLVIHLRRVPQPVIAAVNGAAAGGGLALVLGSDIRLAAAGARFSAAFIKIGVSGCDIGTSWLLPRLIGAGAAHEMMLTGRLVDAGEAARRGLVLEVVEDGTVVDRALDEARLVMANSPLGVRLTKETMWASLEIGGLAAAIALENHTQVLCLNSADQREAVLAFLEKRSPRWAPAPDARLG